MKTITLLSIMTVAIMWTGCTSDLSPESTGIPTALLLKYEDTNQEVYAAALELQRQVQQYQATEKPGVAVWDERLDQGIRSYNAVKEKQNSWIDLLCDDIKNGIKPPSEQDPAVKDRLIDIEMMREGFTKFVYSKPRKDADGHWYVGMPMGGDIDLVKTAADIIKSGLDIYQTAQKMTSDRRARYAEDIRNRCKIVEWSMVGKVSEKLAAETGSKPTSTSPTTDKPNQSPKPTATADTPRARAQAAPGSAMSHH